MTSDFSGTTRGDRNVGEQVRDTAGSVKDEAQRKASEVAAQAQQQVSAGIANQKDSAAHSLSGVAQALRQTGQQLRDQDQVGVTGYIDQAAEQVERLSTYLERNDLGHLVGDLERFARRQPALFLGGAFLMGLIGARFLRSSRPEQYSDYGYRRYSGAPGDSYGGYRGVYGSGMGGAYTPGGYSSDERYGAPGSSGSGERYGTPGNYGSGESSGSRGGYGPGESSGTPGSYPSGESYGSRGTGSDRIPGVPGSTSETDVERTNREQTRPRTGGETREE